MEGNGRPLVPYLRQSRAKERTISIEEQRRDIRAWATAAGVRLAPEVIEQNVSGSKPWRERALGDAVEACERGEAAGIVVAWQDRLSRENGRATAEVWEALEQAGARLVCAAEGLDTATGDHEMLFTIKAAVAREQWKRHRANWERAKRNAAERGVASGRAPIGNRKERRAVRVGPRCGAQGAGGFQVARGRRRLLGDRAPLRLVALDRPAGPREPGLYGPARSWRDRQRGRASGHRLRRALRGRTRLEDDGGRAGGYPRAASHWARALQRLRPDAQDGFGASARTALTSSLTSAKTPPASLARSAPTFTPTSWTFSWKRGSTPRFGRCAARSTSSPSAANSRPPKPPLKAAERQLTAFVENASALDAVLLQRGIAARQARVDEAREAVQHLASRSSRLPAGGTLAALWGSFDALQRRTVLAGFVDRVEVTRGASGDLAGNVRIIFTDGTLAVAEVADDEQRVRVAAA